MLPERIMVKHGGGRSSKVLNVQPKPYSSSYASVKLVQLKSTAKSIQDLSGLENVYSHLLLI